MIKIPAIYKELYVKIEEIIASKTYIGNDDSERLVLTKSDSETPFVRYRIIRQGQFSRGDIGQEVNCMASAFAQWATRPSPF